MSSSDPLLTSSTTFNNFQSTNDEPTQKYRLERRPPDGGYGFFIILGLVLCFSCAWGSQGTFSFIFTDFLAKTGHESSALTVIRGCYSGALSFAGLLSPLLFKKYSMRCVGFCGSVLYFASTILIIFVTTFEELLIVYGAIQAFGYGLMAPVVYTTFNAYYVQKRASMMMISKAIVGVSLICYPLLVEFLIKTLIFQNALAVLAAIHSTVIIAMLLMHPVEWHLKVIKIPITDSNTPIPQKDGDNIISNDETAENGSRDVVEELPNGHSSQNELHDQSFWQKIFDSLDLTLLEDLTYVNIVLGITFTSISNDTFAGLLPMYLTEHLGYREFDAALIMSIDGGAEAISRIILAVLVCCIEIKARYIFLIGAIAMICLRFVFLNIADFTGMAVITGLLYGFQAFTGSPLPLIFGEHLPQERFASGYGLYQFLQGILTFLIQPIAGFIRDSTQSYIICFHFLTILMCLCAIPWTIEICCRIARRRTEDQVNNR